MMTMRDDYVDVTTVREAGGEAGQSGRLCLLVIGSGIFATHPLPNSGEVVIGRGMPCQVRINDPSISRRHALLRLGPPLTIEDLGSANGTRVKGGGLAAGSPAAVAGGEVIELGSVTIIVQHYSPPVQTRRIWPHGYFEGRLAEECARAQGSGSSFALLRLHCARAEAAAQVQDALGELLRAADVVGTYAPGEYEVLLVDSGPADAERLAARIRAALAQREVTVAIGAACYPRDGRSPDALVACAGALARAGEHPAGAAAGSIVVTDGAMQQLHKLVERIAAGTISVLILGETGVGKEVLAETLHRLSPRAGRPFLRLNCAALTETLLESELFGHERGAFTSAVAAKPGLLETADGGTVLLDEVGEMPMTTQVKLLRVIEERQVLRVGGLKPRAIDVRFVAATNRDLETEIGRGTFRQDLLFRLNGITLVIPPLRERVSEISGLARAFIEQACAESGRGEPPQLAADALAVLQRYSWPGNIRELRNVAERAVLLCSGDTITPEHLPLEKMRATFTTRPAAPAAPATPPPPAPLVAIPAASDPTPAEPTVDGIPAGDVREQMKALERRRILEALEHCGGNQTRAAEQLGIPRRTLVKRLDEYGVARPRKR